MSVSVKARQRHGQQQKQSKLQSDRRQTIQRANTTEQKTKVTEQLCKKMTGARIDKCQDKLSAIG